MGSGSSRPSEGSPPEAMAGLEGVNVKRVASTAFHGLAVSNLGVVYSFGDGKSGRLGHGDEEGLMVPQPVAALQGERVSAIAAGGEHSLVVTTHGQVFSFGSGSFGQLGHGDLQQQLTPHLVAALAGVRVLAVQAGALHSLALSDHGAVFSWGLGAQGQLGHDEAGEPEPSKRRRKAPTGAVSRLPSPPSERPRKLTATPTAIQNLPERGRVTAIAAGGFHSLAMTDRGAVYSFGHGMHGQLGHGDTSDQPTPRLIDGLPERGRVVAVAAGAHHSLAVSDRGAIYSFGYGGHGQLGHGDRADQLLPQPVAALEAVRAGGVAGPGGGPVASVHRLVPDLGGVGDEVARRGDTTSHGARAGPSQALCTRAFPKQKANRWSRSRRCCAERQTSQAKKPPEPRKSLTLSLVPTLAKLGRAGGAAVWLAPSPRCEVEERRVAGAAG